MDPRALEEARRFFSGFLSVLGEEGEVEAREEGGELSVNLRGAFKLLPIQDPQFRRALGRVGRLYLKVQRRQDIPLTLDINGEVAAHRTELAARVRSLAQEVLVARQPVELDPMPPEDRRAVHLALADVPGIRTYSVGRGSRRRVVIEPVGAEAEPAGEG